MHPFFNVTCFEKPEVRIWGRKEEKRRHCPTIRVKCYEENVESLIDTGAEVSVISERLFLFIQRDKELPILPINRTFVVGANKKRSGQLRSRHYYS